MKVLVFSAKDFEIPYLEDANKGKHKLTFIKASLYPVSWVTDFDFPVIGSKTFSVLIKGTSD